VRARAQSIGEDDDAVEASSAGLQETEEGFQPVFFEPRPLRNLALVDEMESFAPTTDLKARAHTPRPLWELTVCPPFADRLCRWPAC